MADARVDTIVRGGTVVTASSAFSASVAIRGEEIVAVGSDKDLPEADRQIDAAGKYVLPGPIDCHMHMGIENWREATTAAAYAGLTTIIPFVGYQAPEEESLPAAIDRIQDEIRGELLTDVSLNFILLNTPYVFDSLPEAMRRGVTAYKMFMTYKRGPLMASDDVIARAMDIIAREGGLLQLHCENGDVIEYLQSRAMAEGRTKPTDYPATCPPWAEAEAINRAILLGRMTDCPTYVVHLSTREGLAHITEAQRGGQRIWTETCPQYLLLDESAMERLGPLAKIGPPLRPADGLNQQAMWEGSALGDISNVGSDHSPAAKERKEPGWDNVFIGPDERPIPFGAPSLETVVPLMWSEGVVKRGLSPSWFARVLAENPARIFGLYPRKGTIQPGADADLLIIDPDASWTVAATDLHGNAGYTPYEGWEIRGRPWMTLSRGQVLLNGGALERAPGHGQFLAATGPRPPLAGALMKEV